MHAIILILHILTKKVKMHLTNRSVNIELYDSAYPYRINIWNLDNFVKIFGVSQKILISQVTDSLCKIQETKYLSSWNGPYIPF